MAKTNCDNADSKAPDELIEEEGAGATDVSENGKRNTESGKPEDGDAADAASAELEGEGDEDSELPAAKKTELAAQRDKYLRLAAEYDNFRKRSMKEREMIYSDARADAITRLLPVYDNLQRALKMECTDDAFFKGVEMMMTQLTQILDEMNVKQITAVGEPFDPNRHNAVMMIENPELGEKIVAEEFQKGFTLGERVIRHSTVVVAN